MYAESSDLPTNAFQASFGVGHYGSRCRLQVLDLRTRKVHTLLEGGLDVVALDYVADYAGVTLGCPGTPKWSPRGDVIAFVADTEGYGTLALDGQYRTVGAGPVMTIRPAGVVWVGVAAVCSTCAAWTGFAGSPDGFGAACAVSPFGL